MLDDQTRFGHCTFVAFDTETTGRGAGARLLEIAGTRFCGDEAQATFDTLIDPELPIPPETTEIHQITDEMVKGKPKAAEALTSFFRFAEGAVLVAHNATFDASVIGLELTRCRLPAPENPVLDTLEAARRMFPAGAHSLDTLIDLVDLPRQDARHRALGDAELVRHLLRKMMASLGGDEQPIATFLEHAGAPLDLARFILAPPPLPAGLALLERACQDGTKINLHLDGGGARVQKRIVLPRIWYDWNGATFLEAFCPEEGHCRTFRMEKVVKVEPGASSGFLF